MTQHSQIKADPLTIARLLQDEQGNVPKGLSNYRFINGIHPIVVRLICKSKRMGEWFYQGTPIQRHALVKFCFSTILQRRRWSFLFSDTCGEGSYSG